MDQRTFKTFRAIVAMTVSIIVSIGVFAENVVLPILGMLIGSIILLTVQKNVDVDAGVVEDERTALIIYKASRMAFIVFMLSTTTIGVILFALRNSYPQYISVGFTLIFAACTLLIIYTGFCSYYSSKHG